MSGFTNDFVFKMPRGYRGNLRVAVEPAHKKTDAERVGILQDQLARRDTKITGLQQKLSSLEEEKAESERRITYLEAKTSDLEEQVSLLSSNVPLPPYEARPCTPSHKDNATYLRTADEDASRIVDKLGAGAGASLLDIGCGPGRVAIGLTRRLGSELSYRGIDVNAKWIGWAQENITPVYPSYQFSHLDVNSQRYNPSGSTLPEDFRFPFTDGYFGHICLLSVFTHMMTHDVEKYLHDFHRILKPGGRVFVTAFLEEGVPEVEENPPGYKGQQWTGPLHCVRYERSFFYDLLRDHGFHVDLEDPDQKYQRHLYLTKS